MSPNFDVTEALGIAFSSEQLDAITAPLTPGVIIAGAGSGKTTVMAARVVWLVGTGQVLPHQVLGLTFTRKAAAELSHRVRHALTQAGFGDLLESYGEPDVLTYDAFAGTLVTDHGLRIGLEPGCRLLTEAGRFQAASKVVQAAKGPLPQLSRLSSAAITEKVLSLDAQLNSHLVTLDQLEAELGRHDAALEAAPLNRQKVYKAVADAMAVNTERRELLSLVYAYEEYKRKHCLVEFADTMAAAARLAREVPYVGQTLREQYRVVLLDEYQDTSMAQVSMLRGLFGNGTSPEGQGFPVTAVGDPFQAIYGWRGAAASNIISFPSDFTKIGDVPSDVYSLAVNRRSGKVILDAANKLVEPVRQRNKALADAAVKLKEAPDKTPGEVSIGRFLTVADEVSWIADDIVSRHSQGAHAGGVENWGDIAVLLRTNADITPIFSELSKREVPVEIVGLGGLLELAPIVDIVATLRLLHNPSDNPAAIRLLTGPRWRFGRHDLKLLGKKARQLAKKHHVEGAVPSRNTISCVDRADTVALIDAIADPGDIAISAAARQRCRDFTAELRQLRPYPGESPLDLVRRIVTVTGMDIELAVAAHHGRHGFVEQLETFYVAVGQFVDAEIDISLSAFLAYLAAEEQVGVGLEQAVRNDPNSVKLLTAHKAKGLEWDIVYLPSLVEKKFPNEKVSDNWVSSSHILPARLRGDAHAVPQLWDGSKPAIDEYSDKLKEELRDSEDRLGYVAFTRARQHLIGTCHWWSASGTRKRKQSAYFQELSESGATILVDAEEPAATDKNPLLELQVIVSWPAGADPDEILLRREGAELVSSAIKVLEAVPIVAETLDSAECLARWDRDITALVEEAQRSRAIERQVLLPDNLTATQIMFAHRDSQRFAANLIRPMPRPPAGAAALGTRFHGWVEQRFNQSALFDLEDVISKEDFAVRDEEDFRELCKKFAAGQFGERKPLEIEFPFTVTIETKADPMQIRGRIDAIYQQHDGRILVVDWKTSHQESADPLQLAVYVAAIAEIFSIEPSKIDAAFYYVRTDHLVVVSDLPDRTALAGVIDRLTA